jgi:hypothetical protein
MMFERLTVMKELLTHDGSIYVHAAPNISHYLKVVTDDIFAPEFYQNEIVWQRNTAHNNPVRYGPIHDAILYYTKSDSPTWNSQYTDYDDAYIATSFTIDGCAANVPIHNLSFADLKKDTLS